MVSFSPVSQYKWPNHIRISYVWTKRHYQLSCLLVPNRPHSRMQTFGQTRETFGETRGRFGVGAEGERRGGQPWPGRRGRRGRRSPPAAGCGAPKPARDGQDAWRTSRWTGGCRGSGGERQGGERLVNSGASRRLSPRRLRSPPPLSRRPALAWCRPQRGVAAPVPALAPRVRRPCLVCLSHGCGSTADAAAAACRACCRIQLTPRVLQHAKQRRFWWKAQGQQGRGTQATTVRKRKRQACQGDAQQGSRSQGWSCRSRTHAAMAPRHRSTSCRFGSSRRGSCS